MSKPLLSILFLTLFFTLTTYAQKATIKGKVTEAGKKDAVPFANVTLKGTSVGTSSSIDGNYELKVDAGTYDVVVSAIGYSNFTQKLTVAAGETKSLDIALEKGNVNLEMFVKTEGKFEKKIEELTVSLDVIRPNIIENKNVTSAEQALQQSPGLIVVDNEPQLRGGSGYSFGAGSRVMVLVDDLPLLSGDAGRPSWSFIPVENIEQIEIVKGASSVLYGSAALNGVINIRSAYPSNTPKTRITLFGSVYDLPKQYRWYSPDGKFIGKRQPFNYGLNFNHAQKFGKNKNVDFVVGGNYFWEDSPVGPAVEDGSYTAEDRVNNRGEFEKRGRLNFNLRIRSQKIQGLSYGVNGNGMYSESGSSFLWANDSSGLFRTQKGSNTLTKQTVFHVDPFLVYQGKNGTTHSLRTRYFYLDNNNNNNQGNTSQYFYGEYQVRIVFPKIKNFSITPGVMASYTIGKAQLFAGTPPSPPTGFDSVATDKIRTSALNTAVYVQIEKKLWGRLTLSGGARVEYFRVGKFDRYKFIDKTGTNASRSYDTSDVTQAIQPVFRAGANLKLAEETYLRASFGQGFRFPTIAERFIRTNVGPATIYPNPELNFEKSYSVELGFKQGLKAGQFKGYFDIAGFFQRYENAVEFTAGIWGNSGNPFADIGFKSVNIGKSQVWGIDANLMGTGNITKNFGMNFLIGYTYSNPRVLDPDYVYTKDNFGIELTNRSTSDPNAPANLMKYRFEHLVRADVEFNYKMISLGVSFRYNSFMRNIDKVFLDLDDIGLVKGLRAFRDRNNKGDYVIDSRISYQITKMHKISFIANNVLNRIYSLRPLAIENPRQFMLQYVVTF
jgi:iron complex outermembrane receptor protein